MEQPRAMAMGEDKKNILPVVESLQEIKEMKITDLPNSRLSDAIAKKRWPELKWSTSDSGRAPEVFARKDTGTLAWFDCTIPNDILPIWGELVDGITNKLSYRGGWRQALETVKNATKSPRKMAELIAYYYGDEIEQEEEK